MMLDKPFINALKGRQPDRPPFWLMRQAGRYLPEYRQTRKQAGSFINLCLSPELACEVTMQPLRRYGMDAAILFSDILMVPYGLGQKLEYAEGEGPKLEPIHNASGLKILCKENFKEITSPIYQTVKNISTRLPDEVALIGFAGSPWTVACYMVQGSGSKEWEKVKSFLYSDPIGFQSLIDTLVDITIIYLDNQILSGANAIQLFDSWAGILPSALFRTMVIEPTKRITKALRLLHPDIPIIGFPRCAGLMLEEYANFSGVDAVALDTSVPQDWAAKVLQPKIPVQGNLDPILVVTGGAAMATAVDEILGCLGGGPFIFNLGHGVAQVTPPDHVSQLSNLIKTWPERRK
ncbi:MAG: uroporphyrinogen decarboxylase [Rhodospirillaceae bacterium]